MLATGNSPLLDPSPEDHPSGFTLIELLVVIGIILILIGLFFAGAKIVTAQAKERDTKTMLETCKSMFANYQQATHLTRYPAGLSFGPTFSPATSWTTAQEAPIAPVSASPQWLGTLNPDALWPGNATKAVATITPVIPNILSDTAIVLSAIEALPENQTIIANIPANKRVSVMLPSGATVAWPLDGYGNLIVFVPGGGLGVYSSSSNAATGMVWLDSTNSGIVTSAGILTGSNASSYSPSSASVQTAGQPFFVSAGPDGDLSNMHGNTSLTDSSGKALSDMTDDNIYSFNN